jgi:NADH-quinone oxidoreductase subunit J
MTAPYIILALLTLGSAVAAMTLRNLVHCALALAVTFAGLAAFYLQLDAQFAGFAQLLVYVGAVAILVVFAILLTRGSDTPQHPIFSAGSLLGVGIAAVVFAVLAFVIRSSSLAGVQVPFAPDAAIREIGVRQIGDQLMTKYILPLEVVGLLLTAALIGAVIIALREEPKP